MSASPELDAADEAALLRGLRSGDERAFEAMIRAYGPRLLAVTRRLLRNEEDARDALQETFLSALRSLDQFDSRARLSTWLHRIAVNAALMRKRRASKRPEQSLDELLPRFRENGMFEDHNRRWPQPEEAAERAEVRALVRTSIDELPDTHRDVLVLRDIEGLDTAEAAEVLHVTPNAVKVRLHRARQALRALLDPVLREVTK